MTTGFTKTAQTDTPSPPDQSPDAGRIPALDGIRGLAILAVLFCHSSKLAGINFIDYAVSRFMFYGWSGVELFFALSGFLITGILLDAKNESHYFRNFYMRRVLRIFPLFYLVITVVFFVLPHVPVQWVADSVANRGSAWWYYLYINNLFKHPIARVIGVTWSLAVEEQFYLVWPTVVFFCCRETLRWISGGLVLLAIISRFIIWRIDGPDRFTLSCVDSLAIGVWIAVTIRNPNGFAFLRTAARYAIVAAVLIVVFAWTAQALRLWSAGFGDVLRLLPINLLAGALLIYALVAPRTSPLSRFFSSSSMRMFGKYSYAMYLIHSFTFFFLVDALNLWNRVPVIGHSELPRQLVFTGAMILITLVGALLSWNLFESPLLKLKRFFPAHVKKNIAGV